MRSTGTSPLLFKGLFLGFFFPLVLPAAALNFQNHPHQQIDQVVATYTDSSRRTDPSFHINAQNKTLDISLWSQKKEVLQIQLLRADGTIIFEMEKRTTKGRNRFSLQKLEHLPQGQLLLRIKHIHSNKEVASSFVML